MKKDLSIAMAIAKKNKMKKMAEGGIVSAKAEKRPMPSTEINDRAMATRNDTEKVLPNSGMIAPAVPAAASNKARTQAIKHPKMVPSSAFSTRMRDEEDHLERSDAPASPKRQPPQHDDETEASKKGPSVPALKMKKMAEGGMINENVSMHAAEEDELEHPAGLEMDNDMMKPSDEEIMASHFAEGGEVLEDDDMMQPEPEADDEDHASIAAAIMSKRAKFAAGGMVDIDSNNEEQSNMYYKLNRAALKENIDSDMDSVSQPMDSNEHGDSIDGDEHDRISIMRRKMALKRMAK